MRASRWREPTSATRCVLSPARLASCGSRRVHVVVVKLRPLLLSSLLGLELIEFLYQLLLRELGFELSGCACAGEALLDLSLPWSLLPGATVEDDFALLARELLRLFQVRPSRVHLRPVLDLYGHRVLALELHWPQVAHRVLLHLVWLLEDLLELRLPLCRIEAAVMP